MSKQRITIEVLAAGQPRPYADSRLHVRVTFEHDWNGKGWKPWELPEAQVRERLRDLRCGFTDTPPANWASARLDCLGFTAPGVWEFSVTEPYTD
jgi:hypothetical protein